MRVVRAAEVIELSLRHVGAVTIVDLHGRLTAESAAERQLVRTVRRLLAEHHRNLLLNLEDVPQIDSLGLSQCVEAYTTTTRQGGLLRLEHLQPRVNALLHITHLAQVFDIFEDETAAVASFAAQH